MPVIPCSIESCTYVTPDVGEPLAVTLLTTHALQHQVAAPPQMTGPAKQKAPRIERPTISRGTSQEDWNTFIRKWSLFKNGTDIPQNQLTTQLWQCCDNELEGDLFKDVPNIATCTEEQILNAIEQLSVITISTSVRQKELLSLKQDHGQPIRSYAAQAKGKAQTCALSKACRCGEIVDYTEDMVKLVVISGLANVDIQQDVLGTPGIDNKSLNETISIIENKEMAIRAMTANSSRNQLLESSSMVNAVNTGHKLAKEMQTKLLLTTKCTNCNIHFKKFKVRKDKYGKAKLKEFSLCIECWKSSKAPNNNTNALFDSISGITNTIGHYSNYPNIPDVESGNEINIEHSSINKTLDKNIKSSLNSDNSTVEYFLTSNTSNADPTSEITTIEKCIGGTIASVNLDHHIFDGSRGWVAAESKKQPTLKLTFSINSADYEQVNLPTPAVEPADITVITDTGAQSSLMGLSIFLHLGLQRESLIPVTRKMHAANNEGINVLGAILGRLSGADSNSDIIECAEMIYVSDSTEQFYMSRHAMEQLRIIAPDFPKIGAAPIQMAANTKDPVHPKAPCGCPLRRDPPPRPITLPFKPTEANGEVMKDWLLKHFAASTFNTCEHQPLPKITGPPMRIHINPDATPVAIHTPATTPIHWQEEIKRNREMDIQLGVIERVPPNTPTKWLHRAMWIRKPTGGVRRVVDMQALNKHCLRETHHTVPPFKQARIIPPNTIRSVTDAKNGFHSVPVAKEDRDYLQYLCDEGRFRYCVNPQGYLASGDAYTYRYDMIIVDVLRKTKCVDDCAMWDETYEEHWWRMINYLELVGRNGIILNPSKFQFAQREIDFAGFRITASEVKPLPKYLDAIRSFPQPKRIADIRSWFGLVNQVMHYNKLTQFMQPFRPLLSPKTMFKWTPELDEAFQQSKTEIVKAIEHGVTIFDPNRKTCLCTDWSKTGIGYFLRQKFCNCQSDVPTCCPDGWNVTLANSRFLKEAEQRWAAVEGEALAITWALHDTKYFTLGCDNLVVVTDQRPLTRVFNDRKFDDITNERIHKLKQKTLMWRFKTVHIPGKKTPAADALSRYPVSSPASDPDSLQLDELEESVLASIKTTLDKVQCVTWEDLKRCTGMDSELLKLRDFIITGFPQQSSSLPTPLQQYWRFRHDLSIIDEVIMLGNRAVIPSTLRPAICDNIHSAHQGVSTMLARALSSYFWPGITVDIQRKRDECNDCWRMAPSQQNLPPVQPHIPKSPFEAIAADYCQVGGHHYLIIVDRFSNWPEVTQVVPGSRTSGAAGLVKALKRNFATFGVPVELSSDGGPEFDAAETIDFLNRWGVRRRLSSAYHPRSNGRAEIAVKSMKRLLRTTISTLGAIDTDAYTRAILQFRNTPDPSTGTSPANLIFGRTLRDTLPVKPRTQVFDNDLVRNVWTDAWKQREHVLLSRSDQQMEKLSQNCRPYVPLQEGDHCLVQNQTGRFPKRWDKQGHIVEVLPNHQYLVRLYGSRRLTLRNRKYLRKMSPPMGHSHSYPGIILPQSSTSESAPSTDIKHGTTPPTPLPPDCAPTSVTFENRSSLSMPVHTEMSKTVDDHLLLSTPPRTHSPLSTPPPCTQSPSYSYSPTTNMLPASSRIANKSPASMADDSPTSTTGDNRLPISTKTYEIVPEVSRSRPKRTPSVPMWHKDFEMGAIISVPLY